MSQMGDYGEGESRQKANIYLPVGFEYNAKFD